MTWKLIDDFWELIKNDLCVAAGATISLGLILKIIAIFIRYCLIKIRVIYIAEKERPISRPDGQGWEIVGTELQKEEVFMGHNNKLLEEIFKAIYGIKRIINFCAWLMFICFAFSILVCICEN